MIFQQRTSKTHQAIVQVTNTFSPILDEDDAEEFLGVVPKGLINEALLALKQDMQLKKRKGHRRK